ncbi:hypothetical protein L1D14_04420 [Vibrio tubiashii]|uniref:hypothetical protein n=1 Tax=Vibrio tubiashii TaxID=29498 RepID=UPI001EFEE0D4|nr:hypothetical protein [Vibrio tubiashii]MCG9575477.1 hypothetical protein [Vibrio tubiashii]
MKTQSECIEHYSREFIKVFSQWGAESDYTTLAFYKLQAARLGMTGRELHDWANTENLRLKQITLDHV